MPHTGSGKVPAFYGKVPVILWAIWSVPPGKVPAPPVPTRDVMPVTSCPALLPSVRTVASFRILDTHREAPLNDVHELLASHVAHAVDPLIQFDRDPRIELPHLPLWRVGR